MQTTIASTPSTVESPMLAFLRYTAKPNTIAITMNNRDTMATEALASVAAAAAAIAASVCSVAATVPNVEATIDAKAATTKISVR